MRKYVFMVLMPAFSLIGCSNSKSEVELCVKSYKESLDKSYRDAGSTDAQIKDAWVYAEPNVRVKCMQAAAGKG